jgi:[ribosomal protein S5]-alanine N-acetyltransferase
VSDARLVPLSRGALEALVAGDLAAARRASGVELPGVFLEDLSLWRLRLDQLTADPGSAPWLVRAVVAGPDAVVVGHAGFHGPPDGAGMVEIGYEILPEHLRRGHARAAVAELVSYAREHGAATVRASVSPGNAASLSLIAAFGFSRVGDQWDDEDGYELVFERPV